MGKKNRIRYQSKGNPFPPIRMTGKVWLRHQDEEAVAAAVRGDVMVFLSTDILIGGKPGNYDATGMEGYLKTDVFDGKAWRPLSLEEFFPGREYYFSKRERPSDTYRFCKDTLTNAAGTRLIRTYREHYVMAPEGAAED